MFKHINMQINRSRDCIVLIQFVFFYLLKELCTCMLDFSIEISSLISAMLFMMLVSPVLCSLKTMKITLGKWTNLLFHFYYIMSYTLSILMRKSFFHPTFYLGNNFLSSIINIKRMLFVLNVWSIKVENVQLDAPSIPHSKFIMSY